MPSNYVWGAPVEALDTDAKTIHVDGAPIAYSKLAMTTGTRVRHLPNLGPETAGVYYLRTLEDAKQLKERLRGGSRLIAIGGGFIGLEIAAVARQLDLEVTVLEAQSRLMERAVSPVVSEYYAALHRSRGVVVELGAKITDIDAAGDAIQITLDDGRNLIADTVVVGIGAVPNVELAQAAGIECDNGIVVDEYARTSAADVVAAGDCTMHINAKLGLRHPSRVGPKCG